MSALSTVPTIEIFYGNFLAKTIWRPIINLPVGNHDIHTPTPVALPPGNLPVPALTQRLAVANHLPRGTSRPPAASRPLPDAVIAEVHTMEEKGSDVNLAAHLINDAWLNLYDAAVVISNDTDLVTPLRMVRDGNKKTTILGCPKPTRPSPKLANASTFVRHINPTLLAASQFPDPIPGTTITKPPAW